MSYNKIKDEKIKYKNLEKRTFEFAIQVLDLLELLSENRKTGVIINQLAKSGTSVGANYEEAQASHSKGDFYYKIGICIQESWESNYWLRIIDRKGWVKRNRLLKSSIQESTEFHPMESPINRRKSLILFHGVEKIFGKIYSGRPK